jgi:hypothetical protein
VRRLVIDLEIPFAALARPTTLFTIIVGSWLCRLANWRGWCSIRIRTDSSGGKEGVQAGLGGRWTGAPESLRIEIAFFAPWISPVYCSMNIR